MNKTCRKYYRSLKLLLPHKGREERLFLKSIRERLEIFSHNHREMDYDSICETLGTPQEMMENYFEQADVDHLIRQIRLHTVIRAAIILLIVIILAGFLIRSGLFYRLSGESRFFMNSYSIEQMD